MAMVDKDKFDDLLRRMIAAKPTRTATVRDRRRKKAGKVISQASGSDRPSK